MQTLTTPDGTTIAYQVTGTGPALVLVVGAFCDRSSTADLSELLAGSFTVHEYDRRGRGASTDTAPYAPEREVEDLATVIAATGDVSYVYGHSSGAVIALEAAAAAVPMRALVAYEPPYTAEGDGSGGSDELLGRVRELVAAGNSDGAAAAFLAGAGAPAQVMEMIRNGPGWPRMCELAPTLVLAGGASPAWAGRSAQAVVAAVPGARQSVIAGQDHGVSADAVAPVLREFFEA